ncbi:MAG: hypothetical protein EOL87_17635 [Spartobacteria bacterium]|nr:hypothetical protein [Spartobacteria bacterium]
MFHQRTGLCGLRELLFICLTWLVGYFSVQGAQDALTTLRYFDRTTTAVMSDGSDIDYISVAGSNVIEQTDASDEVAITDVKEVSLGAFILANRIVLYWNPPNEAPSTGVKITRAVDPSFKQKTVDNYSVWLPGTGFRQFTLSPGTTCDRTYFYKVQFVKSGCAEILGESNAVKVDALIKNEDE